MSVCAVSVRIAGPVSRAGPRLRCARAQDLAALAATRSQDRTACLGRHALPEPVRLGALPVVRLVCALHVTTSRSVCPGWPGHKPGDYSDGRRAVSTDRVGNLRDSPYLNESGSITVVADGARVKVVRNLWTMWKTQDSSASGLWITPFPTLLVRDPLCYNRRRSLVLIGVCCIVKTRRSEP